MNIVFVLVVGACDKLFGKILVGKPGQVVVNSAAYDSLRRLKRFALFFNTKFAKKIMLPNECNPTTNI